MTEQTIEQALETAQNSLALLKVRCFDYSESVNELTAQAKQYMEAIKTIVGALGIEETEKGVTMEQILASIEECKLEVFTGDSED